MMVKRFGYGIRAGVRAWLLFIAAAMLAVAADGQAQTAHQKTYATPEDAASALVAAVKAHDRSAILATLGNASTWISSGDAVADRAAGDRFVAAYEAKRRVDVVAGLGDVVGENGSIAVADRVRAPAFGQPHRRRMIVVAAPLRAIAFDPMSMAIGFFPLVATNSPLAAIFS